MFFPRKNMLISLPPQKNTFVTETDPPSVFRGCVHQYYVGFTYPNWFHPISSFAKKKTHQKTIFTTGLTGPTFSFIPPEEKNHWASQTIETFAVIKAILYCLTRLDWHSDLAGELSTATSNFSSFFGRSIEFLLASKKQPQKNSRTIWTDDWNGTLNPVFIGGEVFMYLPGGDFFPFRVFSRKAPDPQQQISISSPCLNDKVTGNGRRIWPDCRALEWRNLKGNPLVNDETDLPPFRWAIQNWRRLWHEQFFTQMISQQDCITKILRWLSQGIWYSEKS